MSPRTTCLYSLESMLPRSLSAASHSFSSNPITAALAPAFPRFDVGCSEDGGGASEAARTFVFRPAAVALIPLAFVFISVTSIRGPRPSSTDKTHGRARF